MEQEIGQPLFLRDNRQVILTDTGERFLHFADQTWADWQHMKRQFSPHKPSWKGNLTYSAQYRIL